MIQEVWLYALGGFLIGFLFSTVWESLYFRQKRMRIAETNTARPEAEAQTPIAPPEPPAPESAAKVDDWPPPNYVSPAVFLESEENEPAEQASQPQVLQVEPPAPILVVAEPAAERIGYETPRRVRGMSTLTAAGVAAAAGAALASGNQPEPAPAPAPKEQAPSEQPPEATSAAPEERDTGAALAAAAAVTAAAVTAAALAGKEEPPTAAAIPVEPEVSASGEATTAPAAAEEPAQAATATPGAAEAIATAAITAAALAGKAQEPSPAAVTPATAAGEVTPVAPAEQPAEGHARSALLATALVSALAAAADDDEPAGKTEEARANGVVAAAPEAAVVAGMAAQPIEPTAKAAVADSTAITHEPQEISIVFEPSAGAESQPEVPRLDGPYSATNLSRSEYAVVRLMQSARQTYRELSSLYRRQPKPVQPAPDEAMAAMASIGATSQATDDLTRIPGLSAAHAERLHLAGVTNYDRLAKISKDELTQLFASAQGEPAPDFDIWLVSARLLAAQSDPAGV